MYPYGKPEKLGPEARFIKLLEERACNGDSAQLEQLLEKYKDNDEMIEVIQRGVDQGLSYQDSGDFRDPPSRGYQAAKYKSEMMDKFHFARGLPKTKTAMKESDLRDIFDEIAKLKKRVKKLERHNGLAA